MIEKVIKRSGRKVKFDRTRIEKAVSKAIINTRDNLTEEKTKD